METLDSPIQIFMCYAREDELLLRELEKQLKLLQRQGFIEVWHDRQISPGADWEREIKKQLDMAHIILFLVSPDFINSDYCYSVEMQRAMERHQAGEACVIPVILRPVFWETAPFGNLQALPTDGKPVTGSDWHNQEEAFLNVAEGIRKTVTVLRGNIPGIEQTSFQQLWRASREALKKGEKERAFRLLRKSQMIQNLTLSQREAVQSQIQGLRQMIPLCIQKAKKASTQGDWQEEIQAWEDLLALVPSKREITEQLTFSRGWDSGSVLQSIQERLDIALQNEHYIWMYEDAKQCIREQNNAAVREQLELLWRKARFYGDPAGLAQRVGLLPACNYEQTLANELVWEEEQREKQRKAIELARLEQRQREAEELEIEDKRRRAIAAWSRRRAIASRLRGIAAGISGGTGVGCLTGVLLAGIWYIFSPPQRIPEEESLGHFLVSGLERVFVFFAIFPEWVSVIIAGVLAGLIVGVVVGCIRSIISPSCYSSGSIAGGIVGFFAGLVVLGIVGSLIGGFLVAALCVALGPWLGMRIGAEMGASIGGKWEYR